MKLKDNKNLLIGLLVGLILVLNVVMPAINKYQAKKLADKVSSLLPQLNQATDQKTKQALASEIVTITNNSKLLKGLPASADGGYTARNGASTTGSCENFMIAYHSVIQTYFNGGSGMYADDMIQITGTLSRAYDECISAAA